jgi:hypothetical protein
MVDPKLVRQQLDHIGARFNLIGQAEANELPHILMEGERIEHLIVGHYSGGFAIMVATNLRLLLVDKKLLFLNVEDIRYDMIAELDYGHQMLGATIHVRSFSKDLKFQSYKKQQLRSFTTFVQHKVMQMRQQHAETNAHIPLQTFGDEPSNELTTAQAQSIIPLIPENWYRANPPVQMANPYTQSPLMTRRRIGRFSPSSK